MARAPHGQLKFSNDFYFIKGILFLNKKHVWVNTPHFDQTYRIDGDENSIAYQVHRISSGITFMAGKKALQALTPAAYMLYMHMLLNQENRCWLLKEKQVLKNTTLTAEHQQDGIQELIDKTYLTPGKIQTSDAVYTRNSYHLWENPEMCKSAVIA